MMGMMQDIPNPIGFPRLPTDSPKEILVDPSGPNFINLDNTNGSDELESTIPPSNPPTGPMNQPEVGRVSVETSVPNPLIEFINVYNDDESPKEYQRTPVHVQEEKEPEKDSSPKPEVQTQ
jgi:hypothetical protein